MKWKILLMILIISFQIATAERDSTKVRYSLGVTPSAVYNIMPAVQLRHNLILTNAFSIGLETGYIFTHIHDNKRNTKGYRLRPQLNLKVIDQNDFSLTLYSFYNYRYNETNLKARVVRADGAYTEVITGDRKTKMRGFGIGVDFGYTNLYRFIRKFNVGIGLGFGQINNNYSDSVFEPESFIAYDREGVSEIPILILHFCVQLF